MKRKLFTLPLAAVLVLTMTVPALAAGTVTNDTPYGSTTVKYDVAETYSVTIPEDVNFTSSSTSQDRTVSASNVLIGIGKTLNVKVSSDNCGEDSFRMKNGSSTEYLKYNIKKSSASGLDVKNHDVVLSVPAGTENASVSLNYSITDKLTKAGNYLDTLTFTVSVDAAV